MGYKKYIKDYRKEYIVKPNGKPGVTATYIGKYFGFVANGEELGKTRLVFSILSAVLPKPLPSSAFTILSKRPIKQSL